MWGGDEVEDPTGGEEEEEPREANHAVPEQAARQAKPETPSKADAQKAKRRLRAKDLEARTLAKKLKEEGQCLIEISADGHCLFSAVSDQLRRVGCKEDHTFKTLRKLAAEYMLNNEVDFKDFLNLEKQSFEAYCRKMERTSIWGGQHELIALSHGLKRNIVVMRHDMNLQHFPDPENYPAYPGDPLRLSYHMHEYTGGEHYNSVVSIEEKLSRNRIRRKLDDAPAGAASAARSLLQKGESKEAALTEDEEEEEEVAGGAS
ncbi:hypothetical protein T484DRAFT_1842468, partial [Baffinella frigidus]